jgi:2-phosphosulfolactate phosphatase
MSPRTAPGDVQGKVVAVIDVLRASTSIAVALASGARTVVPFESPDEAMTRARQLDRGELLLAGERRNLPIEGFDLGNSPLEFTEAAVSGKTIFMTTTNGTRALMGLQAARDVVVAAYVNHTAVTAMLRAAVRSETDILIVCAGEEGHFSLEDAACAGRYVRTVTRQNPSIATNDAALACALIDRKYGDNLQKIFKESSHGQALEAAGFGADLVACAAMDSHPVVPIYQDKQITRLGPDRER